jgi:hypothetical protein
MTKINTESVIIFPIQIRETDDTSSDAETILQCKLVLTKALNEAAAGRHVLSEKDKADMCRANEIFIQNGYAPLHLNF